MHSQLCRICRFSHVLCEDCGYRLLASSSDCYSGTGLLDPLQSCGIYFGRRHVILELQNMPAGERFCLSFSLSTQTHTENGVQSSHPQTLVLGGPSSKLQKQRFLRLPGGAAAFPTAAPGPGLLLPSRPALPCLSLPPRRSPIWAIRAAIYAGSLRSRQSGPFTGHTAVAVSPGRGPTAKRDSLQGMPENLRGEASEPKQCAWPIDPGRSKEGDGPV